MATCPYLSDASKHALEDDREIAPDAWGQSLHGPDQDFDGVVSDDGQCLVRQIEPHASPVSL